MKRLIYQVAVGKPSNLYKHCIDSVSKYCEKYNITHFVQRTPKLWITPDPFTTNRSEEAVSRVGCLPIFEKENAFDLLPEFDQIAIIDADIYVRPDSPNIFNDLEPQYAFGGVVERSMPITEGYRQKIANYSRMQYSNLQDVDWKWNPMGAEFMNMGLMVMNKSFMDFLDGDNAEQFVRRPEFKRFVDGLGNWKWSTDQTLLNYWIKKRGVPTKQMDWRWNALYKGVRDDQLSKAYFIHFFLKDKLPDRGEDVPKLMKAIYEA